MLCFLFVPAFDYKIYCLMLYHLLKSTLHLKANACSIGTFIRFYMQSTLHSKANVCNIGTFIRFYMQNTLHSKANACNIGTFIRFYIRMRVEKKSICHLPFTQQWMSGSMYPKTNSETAMPKFYEFLTNFRTFFISIVCLLFCSFFRQKQYGWL